MTVIGDAYIDIKSKTDGLEDGVQSVFGGAGAKAALAFGAAFAAAGAVTKVLYDMGASFDDAYDKIRVGSGETGKSLEGLKQSARNVFAGVPASMGDVSGALTTLHQKLGLTGAPLENLTKQVLNLSHITGTDAAANVKGITDLFLNFGVAAGDQGPKLDELFRATQQSGLGITDLTSQMAGAGVQLRALGFDFDSSTALIAGLAKQGLSASDVMPSLAKAMAVAAKSGKDASTVFKETVDSIKSAPDATKAASIALDVFGARAGPRMAQLIREGKLSFDDLKASILGGSDTIAKATADTADFSEKFAMFKNKVLLGLEPIATAVFNAIGDGMSKLGPILEDLWGKATQVFNVIFKGDFTAGPFAEDSPFIATLFDLREKYLPGIVAAFEGLRDVVITVGSWIADNLQPILVVLGGALLVAAGPLAVMAAGFVYAYNSSEAFRDVVEKVVTWLTGTALPAIGTFAKFVISSFGDAVAWVQQYWPQISEAIGHVMRVIKEVVGVGIDFVMTLWRAWGDDLLRVIQIAWHYVSETVANAVKVVQGVIQTVLALINGDWGKAWDGIKQVLAGVWDQIKNVVTFAIGLVRAAIAGGISLIQELWHGAWDKLKDVFAAAWNKLLEWIEGGGVGRLIKFFTDLPGKIVGWLGDLGSILLHAGADIMKGLAKGLLDGAKDAVKGALSTVTDLIPDWKGPLSKDKQLLVPTGKAIMGGLLAGIKSGSADVQAYLRAFTANIVSGAQQVSSGIRAAWGLRDARLSLSDAVAARDKLAQRQSTLPVEIAKQLDIIAKAKAAAAKVDPAEQLRIDRAQQAIVEKQAALTAAQTDGKSTALELKIMDEELLLAQQELSDAQKDAVGPTDELTTAEEKLKDLREEQQGIARQLADANRDVESATLGVVDAQAQLTASSAALTGNSQLVQFFKDIAEQAGLSSAAIQQLIGDLTGVSNATNSGPTPGTVPGTRPRLINTVTGRPAFTGPNGEGGYGADPHIAGAVSWTMPDGTRAWYVPGKNIDPGNVGALNGAAGGSSPGSSSGSAPGSGAGNLPGWNIAAGTGPNGIRFTPGGGGMTAAQLQALYAGLGHIVIAPVNYSSIDTKGLLEKMNVNAAVGAAVSTATRLRPLTP